MPIETQQNGRGLVLTIGHSTRPFEDFLKLLKAHSVGKVIDVRTVTRSRHNPQFNRDAMSPALKEAGIGYYHIPKLGGLRRPSGSAENDGLENESFRAFADYMQTESFSEGIAELEEIAAKERVAIMCAEALQWRCHRSLISDFLVMLGYRVEHIGSMKKAQPHRLTPLAVIKEGRVVYPVPCAKENLK